MKRIGFICDIREGSSPMKIAGASRQMRAIPMAEILKEYGVQLFIYSRRHINPKTKMAFGYYIIDNQFIPTVEKVPEINGYWYFYNVPATDLGGLNYRKFITWAKNNKIEIYPSQEFSDLSDDKFQSYLFINKLDPELQPYTELYEESVEQIEKLLMSNNRLCIKPRFGSQGNLIFMLKKEPEKFIFDFYKNKKKESRESTNLSTIVENMHQLMKGKEYIIQSYISTQKIEQASFVIRVIMIYDGEAWHWDHKAVLSQKNSDIANTTQGGDNITLEDLFKKIDFQEPKTFIDNLKTASFNIANFVDEAYPSQIVELGLDFLIDIKQNIFLAELNVSPGLTKPGMDLDYPFKNIFHPTPEENILYDKYVHPHATYLAKFFHSKLIK